MKIKYFIYWDTKNDAHLYRFYIFKVPRNNLYYLAVGRDIKWNYVREKSYQEFEEFSNLEVEKNIFVV